MKQNKAVLWVLGILIVIAAGIGCFLTGRQVSENKARKERELDIRIHRSDLEGLGVIDGPIYVTGHKSPDSDTIGCAVGFAALLDKLGYDAKPVVLGKINNETRFILQSAGVEEPMLLEDASGRNMVLVDHSEYTQSAEGLQDANILAVIDHHALGAITTPSPLIYDARPLGSAATIVWSRYRDYGIEPDKAVAQVMMGSVLSDTKNLTSSTTTAADKEAVKALSALAGVSDIDTFYRDMYSASISYEGMTDEEIFFSDYKEYEKGGVKFSIGCVNAYDEEGAKDLALRMQKIFPEALASTGMDMAFIQIDIQHDDLSCTYLLPSDDRADEVLKAIFTNASDFDGLLYKHEPYASRKAFSVPSITEVLEAFPKE